MLIEAIHDSLAPKEDIERFWQAWGQPDIWRLPHGHVSWMLTPGVYRRTLEWLAPRLEKPDRGAGFRDVQVIAPAETHS